MEETEKEPVPGLVQQQSKTGHNIVKELYSREHGMKGLRNFKQTILVKNVTEMALSRYVDLEQVYKSTPNCLDIEKSGRYLLSAGRDGSIYIHDLYNFSGNKVYQCKVVHECHLSSANTPISIETVQWYPFDSGMFVSSGMDQSVKVWDSNVMFHVQSFEFSAKVFQHHMSSLPNGSLPLIAVASGASKVNLVDLRTGIHCQELRGHTNSVYCCRWSPTDTHLLATGSNDSTIRLWDSRSSRSCLAVLDKDNRKQEVNKKTNIFQSHAGSVNGIEFTADGNLLLSLGSDNSVRCWNLQSLKNLNVPYGNIKNRPGRAVQFSTGGYGNRHFCFVPDIFSIAVFEVETGRKVKDLCGHFNQVNMCYFYEERFELYSGGHDRNILLWQMDSEADQNKSILIRGRSNWKLPSLDSDSDSETSF